MILAAQQQQLQDPGLPLSHRMLYRDTYVIQVLALLARFFRFNHCITLGTYCWPKSSHVV
jgi:hypothetical protein